MHPSIARHAYQHAETSVQFSSSSTQHGSVSTHEKKNQISKSNDQLLKNIVKSDDSAVKFSTHS